MSDKPKRRWYQFSLKTLLVGMTVLCLGPGGYVAYEQSKARRQKAAVETIEKLGGWFDYHETEPARSPSMRQILGDESFGNAKSLLLDNSPVTDAGLVHLAELSKLDLLSLNNTKATDTGLMHLAGLKSLTDLSLDRTQVTDPGLVHIAGLINLESLSLRSTQVTDAGLVHLAGLKRLSTLVLDNTKVTDAGLVHLAGLKRLKNLSLDNTKVADAGLVHLVGLTTLKSLYLNDTQVTDAGVAELRKALPKCQIAYMDPPTRAAIDRYMSPSPPNSSAPDPNPHKP